MWVLAYDKKPWLQNSERSGGKRGIGGFYGRAELTREWRAAFCLLARQKGVPPMEAIHVTVLHHTKRKPSTNGPDIGSCYPAVKAAIDGLVDAGVIPDDCPPYVRTLTFTSPTKTGVDGIELLVERA